MSKRKRGRTPPNLPGFYFDRTKNRYFPLEKSSGGPGPSSSSSSSREHPSPRAAAALPCPAPLQPTRPTSLPALLASRTHSAISPALFERRFYQAKAFGKHKQVVSARCHGGTVTHLLLNRDRSVLLASAKSGHGGALWRYTVTPCDRFYIHLERDGEVMFSPESDISDLSFMPSGGGPVALVGLLGGAAQHGRVSMFDFAAGCFLSTYYVPEGSVWSCCWNHTDAHSLCIGSTREGLLLDIVTSTRRSLHTHKSDVLCVRAAHTSPLVYTGSRNKLLICHDLRSREAAFEVELQSSVGDVMVLGREERVLSSAFSGQVVQWDMRTRRHVVTYPGHVNDYAPVKMRVDEGESVLVIPGKDLQTRIWGLDTGALLNCVPPPREDSSIGHHNIPACEVGLNWAGHYPGFAIAATGLIHWYSL